MDAASPEISVDVSTEDTDESSEARVYTIDELAAATGIPSRTIRFYQSSGALQKPARQGRIAVYGPEHAERLALIGQLQDRGLRMRAIVELVTRIERGEVALDEWLGLEGELQSSWTDDSPQLFDRAQLEAQLGERRPGFTAELVRHGLLEARENGAFLVPSPGLLRLALDLEREGIDLALSASATSRLQRHLERAASDLTDQLVEEIGTEGDEGAVQRLARAINTVRPAAQEWVRLIFAREMERELRARLERGEATPGVKKRRRVRR